MLSQQWTCLGRPGVKWLPETAVKVNMRSHPGNNCRVVRLCDPRKPMRPHCASRSLPAGSSRSQAQSTSQIVIRAGTRQPRFIPGLYRHRSIRTQAIPLSATAVSVGQKGAPTGGGSDRPSHQILAHRLLVSANARMTLARAVSTPGAVVHAYRQPTGILVEMQGRGNCNGDF